MMALLFGHPVAESWDVFGLGQTLGTVFSKVLIFSNEITEIQRGEVTCRM